MAEPKVLMLDTKYNPEPVPVTLHVDSYRSNNSLYIGLLTQTEYGLEPQGNLTVNLLDGNELKLNEAFIDHNFADEAIAFIKKYGLGTVLSEVGHSGFCTFAKVAFDMDKLRELDPSGMDRFDEYHKKTRNFLLYAEDPDDFDGEIMFNVYFPNGLDISQERLLNETLWNAKTENPENTDSSDIVSLALERFSETTGLSWEYRDFKMIEF